MAYHIMEALPDAFTKLVLADSFSGGMLVQLGGKDHDEPTDDSIKASCTLLTPMVTSFPYKVPSQFLVADALLLVNLCLSDKLLKVPVAHAVTPRSMACQTGAVANFELFRIAPADELCDKSNILLMFVRPFSDYAVVSNENRTYPKSSSIVFKFPGKSTKKKTFKI